MREYIVQYERKEATNPKDKCDLCRHAIVGTVVRCKDCKASRVYGKTTQWLACEDVMEGQATDPDGYCYLGERREP